MNRLGVLCVAVILWAVMPAYAFDPGGTPYRPVPQDLAKTCDHYENRARFQPRGAALSLEARFADSCVAALRSLVVALDTNPYEAKRAHTYLIRLTNLRQTVIRINIERRFGLNASPRAKSLLPALYGARALTARSANVSATGEYLIARQMGVIAAYEDWVRSARFQIAAR